jgi:hypothetical protein
VDDKGCVLIACWGMPNMSYLDNAHRALTAAAQIRSQFQRFHMETSVGITCADVYCGTVGSMERMEYAAIGSEVNMAARLMGKAKGRLLVSQTVYSRLSTADQDSLKSIPAMTVKGRTEPLQAYEYVQSAALPTASSIGSATSVDISPACAVSLTALLDKICGASAAPKYPKNSSVRSVMMKDRGGRSVHMHGRGSSKGSGKVFSSFSIRSPFYTKNPAHPAHLTLINGKDGTGKSCVAAWLRQRAAVRGVSVVSARLQIASGSRAPQSLWKKIFFQLTANADSHSHDDQWSYANAIIHEAFPNMAQLTEHVSLATLSEALGVGLVASGRLSTKEGQPRRPKPTTENETKHLRDVIVKIFAHLLSKQPALIIIENVHLAAEHCLDLLVNLLPKLSHPSAIVLTAVAASDANTSAAETPDAANLTDVRASTLESAPWFMTYSPIIAKRKGLSTLELSTASETDLSAMLSTALGGKPVPPELLRLVQDFSGGSYFWVREILQFIKEHGAEQFLSAVGEGTQVEDTDSKPSMPPMPLKRGASMYRSAALPGQRSEISPITRAASIRGTSFRAASSQRAVKDPHHSKLDKLLLVRFGGLPVDAQRVLRTASVIGVTFTRDVLHEVLPRHLKDSLHNNLGLLVRQMWLFEDPDDDQLYAFSHPHAQQVLYELTPSSERNYLYEKIAECVEEKHGTDPAYFTALSHYYKHCDIDKALQYVVKAEAALLMDVTTVFEFAEAVEFLSTSMPLCQSASDVKLMSHLLSNCRRSIEQYTSPTPKEHARSGLWFFALCLNRPLKVNPDAYASSALPAAEERARGAYLSQLEELNEKLRRFAAQHAT